MKKSIFAVAMLGLAVLTGCTSVESTQKFNALGLATPSEKAVCYTHVTIEGLYFFGFPIIVGSAAEDGKCAAFMNTVTVENAVALLTREAKARGAARVNGVSTDYDGSRWMFFSLRSVQASGTAVRSKGEAMRNAQRQYDAEP
ncbi:MAG: hypothetical protein PHI35_01600 [Victivallaceae bacterium]|nr:hypothetical protein [Victivallaceae bacterium]